MTRRFYSASGLVLLSLAAHGSLLWSLDRVICPERDKLSNPVRDLERKNKEKLEFEYIEAPPKSFPEKPTEAHRISDRDALNQDLLTDKSKAESRPFTNLEGPTDQLAQTETSATQSSLPEPAVSPPGKGIVREASMKEVETPAAAQGHSGGDKITTQEMGKIKSNAAQLFGITSFEATGSGMGQYMKKLKEKIWLSWFPYLVFQYPQDYRGADAVISITLDSEGDVKIVQVVESSGSPVFASYCVEAV